MPQMAPMMWLFLFFYFIVLFMLFISNFYFTYCPLKEVVKKDTLVSLNSFSWLW